MRLLCIVALILALCAAASADIGKFSPPDPRLDKKVTLDVNYAKLEDVANRLTLQHGVIIKAGTGTRDWKVREQRVTIHAKEMTLGALLDETAKLLGFCLSREGKEGEWGYVIWQDKKSRDLESEMLNAEIEAAAQRIAKQRKAGITLAEAALKMSPAEAMAQKDKNPLLAYMGGTKAGRGYSQMLTSLGASFPTEYDLMMRGKRAFIPMSALPAGMQQAAGDATSGGLANAFKAMSGKDLNPYQIVMTPATDVLDPSAANFIPQLLNMGMIVMTGIGPGDKPNANGWMGGGDLLTLFPLMDGDTPLGKFGGRVLLQADGGTSIDEVNKSMEEAMRDPSFVQGLAAQDSPTEKEPPTDPDLTREVEIKDLSGEIKPGTPAEMKLGMMMAEAARATGYPVFLESFRKPKPLDLFVRPGKQPVYKLLIGLEKAGYTWVTDADKSIRIRPVDWAFRRSCVIPESFIKHYDEIMDKQGFLTMDDVAQMIAALSEDQIRTQLSDDMLAMMLLNRLVQSEGESERETLRTYASLTPQQKAELGSEAGMPFADLTDEQWGHLCNIIDAKMTGSCIADGTLRLLPHTDKQIQAKELGRVFEIRTISSEGEEISKLFVGIPLPTQDKMAASWDHWKKAVDEVLKAKPDAPAPAE